MWEVIVCWIFFPLNFFFFFKFFLFRKKKFIVEKKKKSSVIVFIFWNLLIGNMKENERWNIFHNQTLLFFFFIPPLYFQILSIFFLISFNSEEIDMKRLEEEILEDPKKVLKVLNKKLDSIEKKIFILETNYLEEHSNMMNSWSNLNVRSSGALSQVQKRKPKEEERIFTLSSSRSREKYIIPNSFVKEIAQSNMKKKKIHKWHKEKKKI